MPTRYHYRLTVDYVTRANIVICCRHEYCDMLHFVLSIFSRISFYINVRTVLSLSELRPFSLWACLLEIRSPMSNRNRGQRILAHTEHGVLPGKFNHERLLPAVFRLKITVFGGPLSGFQFSSASPLPAIFDTRQQVVAPEKLHQPVGNSC